MRNVPLECAVKLEVSMPGSMPQPAAPVHE
jgi:hypothetical protein